MMHACLSISSPELLNKTCQNLMLVIYHKSCRKILIFYISFQHRELCALLSVAIRRQVGWPVFELCVLVSVVIRRQVGRPGFELCVLVSVAIRRQVGQPGFECR